MPGIHQPDDANVSPTDPLPGNSGEKGTSPDATGSQAGLSPTSSPSSLCRRWHSYSAG